MATHTLPTTTHHQPVEDKVDEVELKPTEQDVVSSSKESEDTPKAEETPIPATLESKSEKGAEDEQIEPPVVDAPKKVCDPASESLPDAVKSKTEEQSTLESAVKEAEEQTLREVQEQPKTVDNPESSKEIERLDSVVPEAEAKLEAQPEEVMDKVEPTSTEAEKPDPVITEFEAKLEAQTEQVTEKIETISTEVKTPVVPEVEAKLDGQSAVEVAEKVETKPIETEEPVSVTEEKREAPSEVAEQVNSGDVELEGGNAKKEGTLPDKVEEKTDKEVEPIVIASEQVVAANQEPQVAQKEDEVQSRLPDVQEKKESSGVVAVESLSKETVGEAGEENEAKTPKTEGGNEETSVTIEESTQPIKVEGVKSTDVEVNEKAIPGENTDKDKDIETVQDVNEGVVKDDKPAIVESNNNGQTEEKLDGATIAVTEPVKELSKYELEVKDGGSLDTGVNKLEVSKESDDTKTRQDLPKEAPAKPTQKQSNNIISKVKHSLVKAKKAIIGKSPSSKTLSSQTKDDIKVK